MTDASAALCNKPDCQVAASGKCAEGHDPVRSCPNYAATAAAPEDEFDDEQSPGANSITDVPQIALPRGELMTPEEVQRFLLWRPATFISVIGESFSGKTTVMCALYDRLLRGPYADLSFAGSKTLVALEKRMHPSRVDSGRPVPETVRTSIADGLRYFHFAVAAVDNPRSRTDLFLSDRAGETYRKARSNTDLIADLPEIPQANKIVLLIDGSKVAKPAELAGTVQSARQMLRALADQGAVGLGSDVQVVTSKVDLITRAQDKQDLTSALKSFQERLAADFAPRLGRLTFWDISARDPEGTFGPAHGLDALVRDWVTPPVLRPLASSPPLDLKSEFDRLLARTPLGET